MKVSLNSVAGLSSPKTMKLRSQIMGQPVVALIDPGATHNFISLSLVEDLGIPIKEMEPMGSVWEHGTVRKVRASAKGYSYSSKKST